ncbi:unnamed protein product [Adineta steineri]|uniref:Fe2OG dioxygenase domain-containing protein n=1 Tax=Adineta steineri TaxID=433720 RepID=A0A814CA97_9BILA|nr:unnamed protein product [Adineta steineri]
MSHEQFLGSIDLGYTTSLLTNYDTSTAIADGNKFNIIKHQDDLMLIEVGALLTSDECDEIVTNLDKKEFENMSNKYNIRKRNNSRLIVMDDQLAELLWQRLNYHNELNRIASDTKPLGFNVQGNWEMSSVNTAMRLNKYNASEYFAPHKDAQYAPNGDERSLFSLLIYLTDKYEDGETKFYFPKSLSKTDIKGLTIKEEIDVKPKKGYAILFTHNLLHEATSPKIVNDLDKIQRVVLRSDVVVKRKEKPLGFAISPEEEEDYLACLNFFREAQQSELQHDHVHSLFENSTDTGDLYERSLSIRYCYPRLLETKLNKSSDKSEPLINRLPTEMWLHIFKYIHEQDVRNLVFAYPQFELLKIVWEVQEQKCLKTDPLKPKFIPTIHTQYGSRTLFRFSDADFFYQHLNACCRVVAVYAFFLLGHGKDSTTYTVRYDRDTHDVYEVEMEKLLADAFYNRNCYGSLFRVNQMNEHKRQPTMDLNSSVDRTYMINRHQSQFIGQDLLSRFYLVLQAVGPSPIDENEMYVDQFDEEDYLYWQQQHALYDRDERLVDECLQIKADEKCPMQRSKDCTQRYRKHILNQTEKNSGTSLLRILSANEDIEDGYCNCGMLYERLSAIRDLINIYNHLIFDFETHHLTVERLPDKASNLDRHSLLYDSVRRLQKSIPQENPISFYRVNIEKLATETKGFNHASCQCAYPSVKVDQFSFLDYTHLSHVHLAVAQNGDHVFVLATYGGIAAF